MSTTAARSSRALEKHWTPLPNVHVLSRRAVSLGGYRFVGATLWGDFNLYGNMTHAD
jgi:hypothetical protein